MQKLEREFVESIQAKYGQNITKINLSQNGLRDIENIYMLQDLIKLNLSRNCICDIQPLKSLTSLLELNLAENEISSLVGLEGLVKLEFLDLTGNKIASLDQLKPIVHLPIIELKLQANPICLTISYPYEIFLALPTLQHLDEWDRDVVLDQLSFQRQPLPCAATNQLRVEQISAPLPSKQQQRIEPSLPAELPSLPILPPVISAPNTTTSTSVAPNQVCRSMNTKLISDSRLESLENQVNALNEIFDIQEKTLSMNANEMSQSTFQHFFRSYQSAIGLSNQLIPSSSSSSQSNSKNPMTPMIDPKELQQRLQQFPYLKLLTMWRKQVLQCKINESMLEHQLTKLISQQKKDREQWKIQSNEFETQVCKWKNKSISLVEERDYWIKEQEQWKSLVEQEKVLHSHTKQRLYEFHHTLQSLVHYLMMYRSKADEQYLMMNTIIMKYQSKLETYQRKLQQMEERIQFLSSIWYEKNVEMRNTMATLEAERRMLYSSTTPSTTTATATAASGTSKDDEESSKKMQEGKYLSDLQISAESETLLKTIFRNLDQQDCGQLPPSTLFLCLTGIDLLEQKDEEGKVEEETGEEENEKSEEHEDGDSESDGEREDDEESEGEEEDEVKERERKSHFQNQQSWPLSPIGEVFKKCLGIKVLKILIQSLHQLVLGPSRDTPLTWGEFLLQLIPDPSSATTSTSNKKATPLMRRTPLTNHELKRLQELQLVESFDMGVLPLAISMKRFSEETSGSGSGSGTIDQKRKKQSSNRTTSVDKKTQQILQDKNNKDPCSNSDSNDFLQQENERLRQERQFLLQRLQSMSRSMTRRAEGIKSFFVNEIRILTIREQSHIQEWSELQSSYKTLQDHLEELQQSKQEQSQRYEQQVHLLQQENQQLLDKLHDVKTSQYTHYEQLLEEEQKKTQRLQQEYQLLTREMNKKEVKMKALQRDCLHLQANQSNQSNEILKRDEELQSFKEKLSMLEQENIKYRQGMEEEMIKKDHDWMKEKQDLLSKLAETQEEVIRLNRVLTESSVIPTTPLPPSSVSEAMDESIPPPLPPASSASRNIDDTREIERDHFIPPRSLPVSEESSMFPPTSSLSIPRSIPQVSAVSSQGDSIQRIREEMMDLKSFAIDRKQDGANHKSMLDARLEKLLRQVEQLMEE